MARRRLFPFLPKLTPAKACISVDIRERTHHIANDLQVLCLLDPAAVVYAEHVVADLRARAELTAHWAAVKRRYAPCS